MLDYNSGGREPHIHGDLVDLSEGLSDPRESRWVGPHESDYPGWSPQHGHREKLSHSSRAETLESWRRLSQSLGREWSPEVTERTADSASEEQLGPSRWRQQALSPPTPLSGLRAQPGPGWPRPPHPLRRAWICVWGATAQGGVVMFL